MSRGQRERLSAAISMPSMRWCFPQKTGPGPPCAGTCLFTASRSGHSTLLLWQRHIYRAFECVLTQKTYAKNYKKTKGSFLVRQSNFANALIPFKYTSFFSRFFCNNFLWDITILIFGSFLIRVPSGVKILMNNLWSYISGKTFCKVYFMFSPYLTHFWDWILFMNMNMCIYWQTIAVWKMCHFIHLKVKGYSE